MKLVKTGKVTLLKEVFEEEDLYLIKGILGLNSLEIRKLNQFFLIGRN